MFKKRTPVSYHPIAEELLDTFKSQIQAYQAEPTAETADGLFRMAEYPTVMPYTPAGSDEEEIYDAYMLERSCKLNRDDRSQVLRASCSVVVLRDGAPAFFVTCYMSQNGTIGNVAVYEQDSRGTQYRKTLRWDSRDEAPAEEAQ